MADEVTLSASVRTSLLSLKNTASLVSRTQNRLSTGLKVAGAIDDPVSFFQAKALSDRSSDFQEKKAGIDQGISSLTTALGGISGVENLVRQLKGLALNTKSATSSQISGLVQQFNDLRSQVGYLATDTQYQGLNLVNGTGQSLTVDFSTLTASRLTVDSVDITVGQKGLDILRAVTANGGFQVGYESFSGGAISGGENVTITYAGTATTLTSGTYTFSYGGETLSLSVGSAGSYATNGLTTTSTFVAGDTFVLQLASAGNSAPLNKAVTNTGSYQNNNSFAIEFTSNSAQSLGSGSTISITFDNMTGTTLASGNYTFSYGGETLTFSVLSQNATSGTFTTTSDFSFASGPTTLTIATAAGASALNSGKVAFSGFAATGTYDVTGATFHTAAGLNAVAATFTTASQSFTVGAVTGQVVLDSNLAGQIQNLITRLDTALSTLRSKSQVLGSNVALLQTRLDFTTSYVNTLTAGSGKLTLADLNEEGANLLALQTRQQLGTQALSFAGQAEQSVLSLFR